jgi:membrane protease subunit HflK
MLPPSLSCHRACTMPGSGGVYSAQVLMRASDPLYEMGMTIETVQLQNVLPPEKVRASFNDVNQAEQERARTENEAWQEYNKTIPLAEGESLKVKQQAEGYAIDRVNRATGETARFLALLAEYKKSPEVTRRRLWLETVARSAARCKIVADDDLKGVCRCSRTAENPAAPAGGAASEAGAIVIALSCWSGCCWSLGLLLHAGRD